MRRFQQDDAHIFCTQDQIKQEVMAALEFMAHVYHILDYEFSLELSTRPGIEWCVIVHTFQYLTECAITEKYLGDIAIWDDAEKVCYMYCQELYCWFSSI